VPTLLVTGHTGFVGRSLFDMKDNAAVPPGWSLAALPDGLDIRDPGLAGAIRERSADAVLHLAARTNVEDSFGAPDDYFDVNFSGTLNLLRALRDARFAGRLLYVSSGDCYGAVPESGLPVSEDRTLKPRNPYAVSKVAAEALCYQWSQTDGIDVVIARPFNHIGPGQDSRFAVAHFCEYIARIAAQDAAPVIRAGNLDVTRDFTDVRDVVLAYFALLEKGVTGEAYNVASGREVRVGEALRTALEIAGVKASIEIDPGRQRAGEQRRVVADVSKIRRDTGWQSRIPLRETLEATLDYWRNRVGVRSQV
jgi:GDP-4-dehydro-6-deoxy-D-mannose reductase